MITIYLYESMAENWVQVGCGHVIGHRIFQLLSHKKDSLEAKNQERSI